MMEKVQGPPSEISLSRIVILESLVEAQLIDAILDEENIPHMIRSYHDTAYDGLFQLQRGWGELLAPGEHEREILEIKSY